MAFDLDGYMNQYGKKKTESTSATANTSKNNKTSEVFDLDSYMSTYSKRSEPKYIQAVSLKAGNAQTSYDYSNNLRENRLKSKYSGKSYSDIQKAMSGMNQGSDEYEWLSQNQFSYMSTDELQAEIDRLTTERDNYKAQNIGQQTDNPWLETDYSKVMDEYDSQLEELNYQKWKKENEEEYGKLSSEYGYKKKSTEIDKSLGRTWGVTLGDKYYGTGDDVYAFINNLNGRQDQAVANRGEGAAGYQKYTFMTDEERANYNYLYNVKGKDSANDYLEYISYDLDARRAGQYKEDMAEFATEKPFLASAASVATNLTSGIGLIDIAGQNIARDISGEYKPINYNRLGMQGTLATTAIRGTVSQNIADAKGTIQLDDKKNPMLARVLNGKSLGDVYQLGMSMADSLAVGYGFGPAGTFLLGGAAGSQGVLDAVAKGASDSQALTMGILNGTFEALFEYVSLDKLINGDTGKILTDFLKQGFIEGTEELNTTLFNTIADICVMAEKSDYRQSIQAYIDMGFTPEQAQSKALLEIAMNMGIDFIGGAVTGGIMGGGKYAFNKTILEPHYYSKTYGQNVQELVTESNELNPDNELAKKAQSRLDRGKKVYGRDIRSIVNQTDTAKIKNAAEATLTKYGETGDVKAIAAALTKQASGNELTKEEKKLISESKYGQRVANELNPENIRSGEYNTEWAEKLDTNRINPDEYSRLVQEAQIEPVSNSTDTTAVDTTPNETATVENPVASQSNVEDTVPVVQTATDNNVPAKVMSIEEYSKNYGEQAGAFIHTYEHGQDVAKYESAYSKAYEYAQSGVPMSTVVGLKSVSYLNETQRELAYKAGEAASTKTAQLIDARKNKNTSVTNKTRKKGTVRAMDGISIDELSKTFNDTQRKAYKVLSRFAEATGVNIVLFRSTADANGNFTSEEGRYSPSDDTIYIDINAGINNINDINNLSQYTMLRTFSHEFTHWLEKHNATQYNEFRKLVFKTMDENLKKANGETELTVDDLIQKKLDTYRAKIDKNFTYEQASREVMADAMTDILPDSTFIEQLYKENQDLFHKMWRKLTQFLENLKEYFAELTNNNKKEAQLLKQEIEGQLRYAQDIVDMFDKVAKQAVENYQNEGSVQDNTGYAGTEMTDSEAFLDGESSSQYQIRPPYSDKTKMFEEFVDGLSDEARKTFDLFMAMHKNSVITNVIGMNGQTVKKINIAAPYISVDEWNDRIDNEPKWREAAVKIASLIPDNVLQNMGFNKDGTLNKMPLEMKFKMKTSLSQRLIDALPLETIDKQYPIGDKTITLKTFGANQSVGGEAYRRAILNATREAYGKGKLKKVNIGGMAKDAWGALGFLAVNGKTGASGDFTTLCPQMMYNEGCFYCYRRAAMATGVNNKLVARSVWYTGEILKIKDEDIDMLNKRGGLRIQSFGDWMPYFSAQLADLLYDAEIRGLQVKIITKEPSMIEYIASLREQGIGKNLYFNLSADYVIEKAPNRIVNQGNQDLGKINPERPFIRDENGQMWWKRAMSVEEANVYRNKYDFVNTRIVATTTEEFIRGLKDPTVDVVTGYHGNIRQMERIDSTTGKKHEIVEKAVNVEPLGDNGMPRFSPVDVPSNAPLYMLKNAQWEIEYEGKTNTHKQLAQKIQEEGLQFEYYVKTCCITGRCATCNGKCGAVSRNFAVKNATNRDTESIAYWSKVMNSAVPNEVLDSVQDGMENSVEQDQYLIRVTDEDTLAKLDKAESEGIREWNDISEDDTKGVVKVYRAMQAQPVDVNGNVIPNASVQRIVSYDPLMVEAKVFTGVGRKKQSETIVANAKLFSPMAGAYNGVWRNPISLNEWEMSEGHLERATTVIDEKTGNPKIDTDKKNASYGEVAYYYGLEKGGVDDNGNPLTDVPARYNPYVHTSLSALNDQFSSGNNRPELVTVETLVPVFHIKSGDRLPGAKDRVGAMSWHSGPTSSRLAHAGNPRVVILSRYDKPIRVVPDSEVAESINKFIGSTTDIAINGATVTPSLASELQNKGIDVLYGDDWKEYASSHPQEYFDTQNPDYVPKKSRKKNSDQYSIRDSYAPTFYSQMSKTIDEIKQPKLGASSVVSYLRGRGVKAEEIKWSGIEQWLEGKKSVTKEELQQFAAGSQLQIEEETLSVNGAEKINEELSASESDDIRYQLRESNLSDREVLRYASQNVWNDNVKTGTLSEEERVALWIFQRRLNKLDKYEQQRLDLLEQRRSVLNGREKSELTADEKTELRKIQNNLDTTNGQIKRTNEELLKIEHQKVLQKLLKQARRVVERDTRQRGLEELQAYKNKRNESESTRKYRERVVDHAMQLSDWLKKNSDKEHIPEVLKKPLAELLTSIDFSSKRFLNGGELTNADKKFGANLAALNQLIAGQQGTIEGDDNAIDNIGAYLDISVENRQFLNELVNAMASVEGTFTINRMTSEQLKSFSQFLANLSKAIRLMNKTLANARYQNIPTMAQNSMAHFEAMGNAKTAEGTPIARFLQWTNTTPYYAFKRFGEAGESLFDGFTKGWEKLAFNAQEIINFTNKTYSSEEANAWRKQIHDITLEDGSKIQMTTAQIMELSQLLNREQARKHIQAGGIRIGNIKAKIGAKQDVTHYHFTIDDCNKVVSLLTDRQKNVAESLRKYMGNRGGEWGNEISMARFGYRFYTEGEDYYTIRTDSNGRPMKDTDEQTNSMFRLLNLSSSKSLNPKANNALIVNDIFDTFSDHMADMAKLNALGLPLLDAIKWFNYTEKTVNDDGTIDQEGIKKSMEKAFGTSAGSYFRTLLKDINGVKESGDRGGNLASKMMSNYKVAAVASNLRVALLQPTSYVRAMYVLNPKNMVNAFFSKNAYKEAMKYSGTAVWKSLGYYDTDISKSMRSQIEHDETWKDKLKDKSMILAEKGDQRTWGRLWVACKLQAKQNNPSLNGEELCKATADIFREVIYATQVMDSTLTRSEMMRGSTRWTKIATAFMAEPTLSMNILMDSASQFAIDQRKTNTQEAWRKNKHKIALSLITYVSSAAASALIESIADAFRDDDDYETLLQKISQAFFGEDGFMSGNFGKDITVVEKIPIVKDIINTLKGDKTSDMSVESVKTIKTAFDIWKETIQLANGTLENPTSVTYNGKMTPWGKIYKSLQALSQLSGFAVSNLTRDVVAIYNGILTMVSPDSKHIKTYDAGAKNNIKYAYQDGYLTEEEAISKLIEEGEADDKNDAYWIVNSWETGSSSDYSKVYDAMISGGNVSEAIKEMTDHGYTKDKVIKQMQSKIGEWYKGTDDEPASISESEAVSMLTKYCGLSSEEAREKVSAWKAKKDTGMNVSDIGQSLADGEITQSKAESMWKQYGGLTADEAHVKAQAIVLESKYPGWNGAKSAVTKYQKYGTSVMSESEYVDHLYYMDQFNGTDNDGDGETDRNSLRNQRWAYIDSLNISSAAKDALHLAYYKDTTLSKAPWH